MRHSTLLTEYTDISQRLEYLVAHSSQMVFITGEDVAVQQGFVEAFLGQQSQQANVALINARKGKSDNYYRQLLAEQLQCSWQRNQSLVQAFAARDNKAEPVLIAITSAESIPEDVLRELWDLVLQNRFARNGEQINILMFGDHFWAEDVKSWLPTNNNDKPVLLTTQTLEYDEETEVEGDLDELIANRRKLFQERMKSRASRPALGTAPLQKWWVKLALAMAFVLSFSSILIWQYFDVTSAAVTEFSQFLFQSKPESNQDNSEDSAETAGLSLQEAVALANEENNDDVAVNSSDNQRVAANFSDAMQRLDAKDEALTETTAENNQENAESASQAIVVNTFTKQSPDSPSSEYIADISAEQLKQLRDTGKLPAQQTNKADSDNTVSGQQPAAQSAQVQQTQPMSNADAELSASVMDALVALEMLNTEVNVAQGNNLESNNSESNESVATNSLVKNPDVAENVGSSSAASAQTAQQAREENRVSFSEESSVAQQETSTEPSLASQANNELSETASAAIEPAAQRVTTTTNVSETDVLNQETAADTTNVNDYPVEDITSFQPIESGSQAAPEVIPPRYQYHEPVLLELADSNFVLQVSGISTEALLQEFLVDNQLLNDVWVYKTQRYGGDWFVVLVKQSFASLDAARAAAETLPEKFGPSTPFAKAISQVRNEITVN